MKKPALCLLLGFVLISTALRAQTDTRFWFVAPDCTWPGNAAANTESPVFLRLTSQGNPATVTISQPANPAFTPLSLTLAANAVASVNLTNRLAMVENAPANQVLNKGLLIESTQPITAYYEQSSIYNPDIFSLKGRNALGTSFIIPAQNTWSNNIIYTPPAPTNGFDIVATEDNTVVTIRPTAAITGHPAGTAFSITLQRGQTWSAVATGYTGAQHLGGTTVTATAPVAITVKDDFLNDPAYGTCSDLAGDQIVPVALLGKRYIAIQGFLNTPNDKVFVMATQDNTSIQINGANAGTLNTGQILSRASNGAPLYIEAGKPVSVFHISGFGCEVGGALLPPVECTGSRNVGITRSDNKPIHLLLLVPNGGEGGFSFNGSSTVITAAQFQPVPNTGGTWRYARIDISSNLTVGSSAYISNSSKDFHLGIIHGDAGGGCRYGYFSDYSGFTARAAANGPLCAGATLSLTCEVADATGVTFQWTGPNGFSSNAQNPQLNTVSAAAAGTYTCVATKSGCGNITTSVTVTVSPQPAFTVQSNSPVCTGSSLNLSATDAGSGAQYNWTGPNGFSSNQQNPVISNCSAANAGTYTLTVTLAGCSRNQQTEVVVQPTVTLQAGNTGPYCEGQTVQLNALSNLSGAQYNWTGPNGFSSSQQNPVITSAQANASGTYTVSLNPAGCGNSSASTTVRVNPGPGASITGNQAVCEGSPLQLSGTTGSSTATLQWTGPGGFSSQAAVVSIPSASPGNGGVYSFSASENGCTSTAVYTVTVQPRPVAAPAANSPVCEGQALQLSNPGGSGFSYQWTGPNGFSSTAPNPVISNVSPAAGGSYQLTVSASGCPDARSGITVTVTPGPQVNATAGNPVCAGGILQLSTPDTYTGTVFSWTGPNGFSSSLQNPVLSPASPLQSGSYFLTATFNGCSNRDTTTATVLPLPDATLSGPAAVCRSRSARLTVPERGGTLYQWTGPGGFSSTAAAIQLSTFSDRDTGLYRVQVSLNGCSNRDSIRLQLLESPRVSLQPVSSRCADAPPLQLSGSESSGISGTGVFSGPGTGSTGNFSPAAAGAGTHILQYRFTATNGCADTAFQPVDLFALPQVQAGPDRTLTRGNRISLSATVSPATATLRWTPAEGLDATTVINPQAGPDSSTLYTLTATSPEGCSASDAVWVKVIAGIFIPNAFSPNGDGLNDRWNIAGLESLPDCEVYIYNRYGELVFASTGYARPWDGRYKGKEEPAGAYVYVIRPNDGRRNIPLKGSLLLIR